MEKDIKEMEYHGPGWHEALWFPSSRQVTFSLIGFILLVYIAKSCLRDLPLGGSYSLWYCLQFQQVLAVHTI